MRAVTNLNNAASQYMSTDTFEQNMIRIDGSNLLKIDAFKHLGSILAADGSL